MTHRGGMVMLVLFALLGARAGAQDTARALGTWKPVVLTNFGLYAVGHREREPTSYGADGVPDAWRSRAAFSFRVLADWGVILPVSPRSGVGASFVVSLDNDYSFVGLYGRYRHRIDSTRSIDLAVGVPVSGQGGGRPLGLLKYHMTRAVGVAVRPEIHREFEYVDADAPARYVGRNRMRVAVGAEIGGLTGAITSVATAAAIVGLVIAILSSGEWS